MNDLLELSTSAVARLDALCGLIQARRANAANTAAYIDAHRSELSDARLAALQSHLDDLLASLDMMDADYAFLAGSPCNEFPKTVY